MSLAPDMTNNFNLVHLVILIYAYLTKLIAHKILINVIYCHHALNTLSHASDLCLHFNKGQCTSVGMHFTIVINHHESDHILLLCIIFVTS